MVRQSHHERRSEDFENALNSRRHDIAICDNVCETNHASVTGE